jgi:hypothetical protein
MKEHSIIFSTPMVQAILSSRKTQTRRIIRDPDAYTNIRDCAFCCPYGGKGDHLWVRETWNNDWCDHVIYKANGGSAKEAGYAKEPRWKSSIYMPRTLSRIDLEIINVKVECLQEITESAIEKEGTTLKNENEEYLGHRNQFKMLWNKINEKRGFGWEKNPYVWVIDFKRIEQSK